MKSWTMLLAFAWLALNSESSERIKIHYYEGYGILPGFKEIVITNEIGYYLASRGFCKSMGY
jgi:hypothetical protein